MRKLCALVVLGISLSVIGPSHALDTPTLTAPTGTGNTTTPIFTWTTPAGSTVFDLWTDSLTSNTSQIIRQTSLTGTSFTPATPIADSSVYRAWIRAGDGTNWSDWSDSITFGTGDAFITTPTDAPTVTAPTGTNNGTTPQFTWTTSTGADFYDIYVTDKTSGTDQIIRQTNVVGTTFTPATALPDQHAYAVWIRGGNVLGYGPWSSESDFGIDGAAITPPANAPTITAPTGSGNTTTPTAVWTDVAGESFFDVWIDTVPAGASPIYRNQNVVGTSITLTTPLPDNSSFNIYVRAGNPFGFSPWSAAQAFATGTGAVGPPTGVPTITAPSGSGNITTPTFTWTAVSNTSYYDIWCDCTSLSQAQIIRNTQITGTNFTPTTALPDNQTFTCWVRATNGFGAGSWSQAQVFATGNAPATPPTGSPTITAPTGAGNTTTPQFAWTAVDGASLYDAWLDNVSTGQSQYLRNTSITGTTFTPTTPLEDNTSYRLYVRATNVLGAGSWSQPQVFATGAGAISPPTGVPTLTAPIGNGIALTPTFTWSAVAGATVYDLWLDNVTDNVSAFIRQPALTTNSFTPTTPLLPLHSYRWWVRSGNVFGFASWSAEADFTTSSGLTVSVPLYFVNVQATDGNGAVVNYSPATAIDSADPSPQIFYSRPSGTLFPIGNFQQVFVTATDKYGNVATTNFYVTVGTISIAMPDMTVPATDANGAVVSFSANVTDLLDPAPQVTYDPPSGSLFPIGPTEVTISVTDGAGGTASQFFTVNVQAITVTQPDISVTATDQSGATVDFTAFPATISDPLDPAPSIGYSQYFFPIGTTRATIFVSDSFGNQTTQDFNVTVTSPLTLTVPADVFVLSTGNDGAVVNYPPAVAVDVNDSFPNVSYSIYSGSLFPIGTTVVTVTATDFMGITATTTFNVTVGSTFEIVPPADIVAQATLPNGVVVNYPQPTVSDPGDLHPVITFSQNSGSVFPIGTTTVTISGTDIAGNTELTSFNVTVNSAITITPPADVTVPANDPAGAIVTYPAAAVLDLADPAPVVSYSQNSGTLFPPGTTAVTITVTDAANNQQTATFNVIVNTLSITQPADIVVPATSANSAVVNYPAAVVTDPADANPVITYSQNAGTAFFLGTTAVSVTATDSLGNSATATFNVTVTSPMTLVPPADVVAQANVGNNAYVTWPDATVSDPLDPAPALTYNPPNPSYFNTGTSTVTVVAVDKFGNSATASFNIIVTSTLAVTPPADVFAVATGQTGAIVSYPAATGDQQNDTVTLSYSQASGTLFPIGTTTVSVFAKSDIDGNTAAATFHVTVAPPLVVSPPVDIAVMATDPNGALIHYPPASVADALDPVPVVTYSVPNDTEFSVGTTTVNVNVVDSAGFTASTSFKITVYPPISIVPPSDMVVLAADGTGATVNFQPPQVFDTLDPAPLVTYSIASGSVMPVGNTIVAVTATDAQGFAASAYFTVSVVYFTITPPADIAVHATDPAGVVVNYPPATINTLTTIPITVSYSQASGTLFAAGQNVVTITATDAGGDIGTATFNVNVHSLTIVPPADVIAEAADPKGTLVTFPQATVTDVLDPNPSVSYSPDINFLFPIGTTPVTITAVSAGGDMATATFNVIVQDTTPPSVTQPADAPVFGSPAGGAVVYYPPVEASDNGTANLTVTYSQNSGTVFPVGTTAVTVTVTDNSGNSTTAVFNVVVTQTAFSVIVAQSLFSTDTTPPVIHDLLPPDGTITNIGQPMFSAGFYDGESGIDVTATSIMLDGVDITTSCTLTVDGFSYLPPAPLSEGSHQLTVTIADLASNVATASTTVTTIYSPPTLTFDNVVNGVIHFPADTVPNFTAPLLDEEFAANGSTVVGSRAVHTRGFVTATIQSFGSGFAAGTAVVTGDVSDFAGGFGASMDSTPVANQVASTGAVPHGGKFTITLPNLVPDREYDVTAVTIDSFGTPYDYHVKVKKDLGTSNLDVQLITPTDGQIFSTDAVTFAGTMNRAYTAGTTMRVEIDGVQFATATPDQDGNYTATAYAVPEGIHVGQVIAITADNHAAATDKRRFAVDKSPPGNVRIDGPNDMVKHNQGQVIDYSAEGTFDGLDYVRGIPPPYNGYASPTWFTGTIDDAGTGALNMDVEFGLYGTPTQSPALLLPTATKGRNRWIAQLTFPQNNAGYVDQQFTSGAGGPLACRAQDGAGHPLASPPGTAPNTDPTAFQYITPNGGVFLMPLLVGPRITPESVSIQKGDEIIVSSKGFNGNVVNASGTSYVPVPTPQPTYVNIPGGVEQVPAQPNVNSLYFGRLRGVYGETTEYKLLRLKYDTPGGYSVDIEDLAKTVEPNPSDPNNPRTFNANYGFRVNVLDLPMALSDGAGNAISAADQKNGITVLSESADSIPDINDPNLLKFNIRQPVGPGPITGMPGAINVTVCAPGAAIGGGNARILVRNYTQKLVPQGGVPIPMSFIDPVKGLDLYVQVTSPSLLPRDIGIIETYATTSSVWNKTLVNAFWMTGIGFEFVDMQNKPVSTIISTKAADLNAYGDRLEAAASSQPFDFIQNDGEVLPFDFSRQPFTNRRFRVHIIDRSSSTIPEVNLNGAGFAGDSIQMTASGANEFFSKPILLVHGKLTASGSAYLQSIVPDSVTADANSDFKEDDELVATLRASMIHFIANIVKTNSWHASGATADDNRVPPIEASKSIDPKGTAQAEKDFIKSLEAVANKDLQFVAQRSLVDVGAVASKTVTVSWVSGKAFRQKELGGLAAKTDYALLKPKIVTINKGQVVLNDISGNVTSKPEPNEPLDVDNHGTLGTSVTFNLNVPADGMVVLRMTITKNGTTTAVSDDFEVVGLGSEIDIPTTLYKVVSQGGTVSVLTGDKMLGSAKDAAAYWSRYKIKIRPGTTTSNPKEFSLEQLTDSAHSGTYGNIDDLHAIKNSQGTITGTVTTSNKVYFVNKTGLLGSEFNGFAAGVGKIDSVMGDSANASHTLTHEFGHNFGLVDIEHPGLQEFLMYHLNDNKDTKLMGIEVMTVRKTAKDLFKK